MDSQLHSATSHESRFRASFPYQIMERFISVLCTSMGTFCEVLILLGISNILELRNHN